jgi:hypothetical protein
MLFAGMALVAAESIGPIGERRLMRVLSRRRFLAGGSLAFAAGWVATSAKGADPQWVDRRIDGPFQCAATFSLAALDDCFADLGRLERELQRTLALQPAREPIEIFLFADESSHKQFLTKHYPQAPYRRALYVQRGRRGAVYAYQHAELPIDLRHECTHALLHASLTAVPLWLDEGLAEYFEMPERERPFGHPHLAAVRWSVRLGTIESIESLEARRDINDMGPLEYQHAWAWTHFMLHGPLAAHRTLVQYLADLRAGRDSRSFSSRLRIAMPDVDRRLVQHFQHWLRTDSAAGSGMRNSA